MTELISISKHKSTYKNQRWLMDAVITFGDDFETKMPITVWQEDIDLFIECAWLQRSETATWTKQPLHTPIPVTLIPDKQYKWRIDRTAIKFNPHYYNPMGKTNEVHVANLNVGDIITHTAIARGQEILRHMVQIISQPQPINPDRPWEQWHAQAEIIGVDPDTMQKYNLSRTFDMRLSTQMNYSVHEIGQPS